MSMHNIWTGKRGTTLVEILVVMVILLVGIMTVIQMFPTGFGVVKIAESRTIATRLAQQELERWKNMTANLPTGILPIDDDETNGINILNGQYPASDYASFIKRGENWVRGNVLNIRWILGETTAIPAPGYYQTANGTGFGARYTLAFSPIDVYSDGRGELQGLVIRSGDLRRINARDRFSPPMLRRGQYAIYYMSGKPYFRIAFPTDAGAMDRTYYVSYSYWAARNGAEPVLMSMVDQRVNITFDNTNTDTDKYNYNGGWIDVDIKGVPTGYTPIEVEPNTDTCARGFVEVPVFDNDPYEYQLADPILGVISFNPTGHGAYEYTATGKRPIEARIDYRIYDPRILREDRTIPEPATAKSKIPIKLALRFILDAGESGNLHDGTPTDNPDEPTFEGLMRGINGRPILGREVGTQVGDDTVGLMIPTSMLIIDLATGLRVDMSDVKINYITGTVKLPQTANLIDWHADTQVENASLPGRHIRFFYRADGDWSVQCQKAYATYQRVYDPGLVNYCQYYLYEPNVLLFAACEGAKTVTVDYSYVLTDSDGNSTSGERRVAGQSCQISDHTELFDGVDYYFAELKVPTGETSEIQHYRITRLFVTGTSFKARVIWRDAGHWRNVDLETSLVREQSY
ncbi:type II secretion system GspH family protein [bacterium]|nr:type II secretion system GspH family protein [bacterium]